VKEHFTSYDMYEDGRMYEDVYMSMYFSRSVGERTGRDD